MIIKDILPAKLPDDLILCYQITRSCNNAKQTIWEILCLTLSWSMNWALKTYSVFEQLKFPRNTCKHSLSLLHSPLDYTFMRARSCLSCWQCLTQSKCLILMMHLDVTVQQLLFSLLQNTMWVGNVNRLETGFLRALGFRQRWKRKQNF